MFQLDLDLFKEVNDAFGHQTGDRVLQSTAQYLLGRIRASDIVARLGGDEFAVILNDTSADNATRLIERFLEHATELSLADVDDALQVSCSAGYTEIHTEDDVESLIKRADAALYEAKAAGRNVARLRLHTDAENAA